MKCVNRSNKDFKNLAKATGLSDLALAAKIGSWQTANNTDGFPSFNELLGVAPGSFVTYNNNPELSNYGTDIDFGRYVNQTGDTSVEGFVDYQSTQDMPDSYRKPLNNELGLSIDLLPNKDNGFDTNEAAVTAEVDSEVKKRYFNNKTTEDLTVSDMITAFEQLEPENQSKSSLTMLKRVKNDPTLKGIKINISDNLEQGEKGRWDSVTNEITLSNELLRSSTGEIVIQTVLHELVHAKTASAILEPSTPEELELNHLIRQFIDNYSSVSDKYGFTNEMEFVAELYSNPDFVEEVRNLSDKHEGFKGVWDTIINAIRRIFNMPVPTQFDKLLESVIYNVEVSEYRRVRGDYGVFHLQNEYTKNLVGIVNKLDHIQNSVLDNLYNHRKIIARKGQEKLENGSIRTLEDIDNDINLIESTNGLDKALNIIAHVKDLSSTANVRASSASKLVTNAKNIDKVLQQKRINDSYLMLFDMVESVNDLVDEVRAKYFNNKGVFVPKKATDGMTKEIAEALLESKTYIENIRMQSARIEDITKQAILGKSDEVLGKAQYASWVEYKFREKYRKLFLNDPELQAAYKNENTYINHMFTSRRAEYDDMLIAYAQEVKNNMYKDLSFVGNNASDLYNSHTPLVRAMARVVDLMEIETKTKFRKFNVQWSKLHDEYNKAFPGINQAKKYSNLLHFNEQDNKYYLKNVWSHEVFEEYQKAKNAVYDRIQNGFKKVILTEGEYGDLKDYGLQSIYRKTDEHSLAEGDNVNFSKSEDKTTRLNANIKRITTLGSFYSLTPEQRQILAKSLGFGSMEEVFDSKYFATANTKHSKAYPLVYEYLQNKDEGSLDIIQYLRKDQDKSFKLNEQPEIQAYYNKYMDAHEKKSKDINGLDVITKTYTIKDNYRNEEYNKLTDIEQRVLESAKGKLQFSKGVYGANRPLVHEIPGVDGYAFMQLPIINKSELELRGEGDFKGIIKDRLERLKIDKNDDINNANPRDYHGKIMRQTQVNYRNHLDKDQVSMAFFDVISKEYEQAVVEQYRKKYMNEAIVIMETSRHKKYLKEEKGGLALNRRNKFNQAVETPGSTSNELARLEGIFETFFYGIYSHSDTYFAGYDANKIVGMVNGMAAGVALTFNEASGVANILNGMVQLHLDAVGKLDFNLKDLSAAEAEYTKDMPHIFADLTKAFKQSKTNQLLDMFNVLGNVSHAQQEYIRTQMVNKFGSTGITNMFNESGEHMMASVLTMSILKSIKVLNNKGSLINKNGDVVNTKEEAASLYDMLEINQKTGLLEISKKVEYTTHTLNKSIHSAEGLTQVSSLIKKRSTDLFGAYDSKRNPEMAKKWYGKAVMMFKRFFISGIQHRYMDISTVLKSPEELNELDRTFDDASRRLGEGYYTSAIRMALHTVPQVLKGEGLKYVSSYYNNLTLEEQANVRKATAELVMTLVILPAIGLLLSAAWEDDDDKPYFLMYQIVRLQTEMGQFYNPQDLSKIANNPLSGLRFVQNSFNLAGQLVTPVNFNPDENESYFDYLSNNGQGENKLFNAGVGLTPGIRRFTIEDKDLFNQMSNNSF